VTGDPNPATTRLRVTFTATVTGTAPTGTVTFTDGATVLCANVALNASGNTGTATCSLFRLSGSGTHTITASYSGNATNLPSSGSVAEVVN